MKRLSILLVACSTLGCVTAQQPSFTFKETGLRTAASDLQCNEGALEVSVLNTREVGGCPSAKLAVRGCGKETIYECDPSEGWYRTSVIALLGQ